MQNHPFVVLFQIVHIHLGLLAGNFSGWSGWFWSGSLCFELNLGAWSDTSFVASKWNYCNFQNICSMLPAARNPKKLTILFKLTLTIVFVIPLFNFRGYILDHWIFELWTKHRRAVSEPVGHPQGMGSRHSEIRWFANRSTTRSDIRLDIISSQSGMDQISYPFRCQINWE